MQPTEQGNPGSGRRLGRRDAVAGAVVALLVLAGGAAFALRTPPTYEASVSVVVLPDPSLAPDVAAGYYDTLSQGQVVDTFAEVLRLRVAQASPAGAAPTVTVQAVPNTAVIQVTGSASTPTAAATAADGALSSASFFVNQAYAPYRVALVHPAAGTAHRVGVGRWPVLAAAALVALVAGLVVQQAVRALAAAARTRTRAAAWPPTGQERGVGSAPARTGPVAPAEPVREPRAQRG